MAEMALGAIITNAGIVQNEQQDPTTQRQRRKDDPAMRRATLTHVGLSPQARG